MSYRRRPQNSEIHPFREGDSRAISDLSGFKYNMSEMREMEGILGRILVHKSEWNPMNPQLHPYPRTEYINTPNARPRPPLLFEDPPDPGDL